MLLTALAARHERASLACLLPAALFVAAAAALPPVMAGGAVSWGMPWIPSLGIELAFRIDGLSLLFALLITGIGTGIFLYAAHYLRDDSDLPRFLAFLTLFMVAMLGAVLADDLVAMLVFWEVTSFASFLLIGYRPAQAQARRAAQQGLLVTVGGGLALLAGIMLIGETAGTYRISTITAQAGALATDPLAPLIITLVATGAFAKSAQSPLHFWLPNAMVAPTPVSAFLHSATMVKLGVYLLARLNPALGSHGSWTALLVAAGLATMLTGTVLALREKDLKRVLAYSTVVSLGTLVTLIGLPAEVAASAIVTFLLVHALYKACLFMIAGIIDHEAGTRDASALGGLARSMPLTATVAVLAGLSMAGLPPFVGFVGKEMIYQAGLTAASPWIAVGTALLANACMVVVAGVVTVRCFFGRPTPTGSTRESKRRPSDPAWGMLVAPAALAVLGLVFGVHPALAHRLLGPAASAVAGHQVEPALALWHGFTPILWLSVATFVLGVLLLWHWRPMRSFLASRPELDRWGPDAAYDRLMADIQRFSIWQTRLIQGGSLRRYLRVVFAVIGLSLLGTLALHDGFAMPPLGTDGMARALVLFALLALATGAVVRSASFTAGIAAAGMVGFGVALVFLFHGAPDLAFTQFAVEALAVVLLLAVIGRMPFREQDQRDADERRRDAMTAALLGVAATAVLLAVVATPFDARLSDYFREASVPEAHGRNLVNVIIVDFRALDTLGEISVLALAALSATALIASVTASRRSAARRTAKENA